MMKLYYSPGSCAMAPHIALIEAELPFTIDKVNFKNRTCTEGNYLEINPKGSVPAMKTTSGQVLTECAVLLQYIADQNPGKKLIPAPGTLERYKCQETLNFIATELHKACNTYWYLDEWTTNTGVAASMKAEVQKLLGSKLDLASEQIRKNGHMFGSSFSVADIYLFVYLSWYKYLNMDLAKWPTLNHFYKQMLERPSVQKAMKAEGLI